jgi:Glycosyl hydrolases family 43
MFKPGKIWNDTSGRPIQAHAGGFLYDKGRYYWFGQVMDKPTVSTNFLNRVDVTGISCYSSVDLYHWKNEGLALPAIDDDPDHDLHPSKVVERPKVIFNERTGQYVMWMHIDHADYTFARVGVAVSNTVTGPYTYLGSLNPCGKESRDLTIFQDDDGRAYLLFASEGNETLVIAQLTDDYQDVSSTVTRNLVNQKREAPAIFKHDNTYYLITSGCTGWQPNEARYATAKAVLGPWQMMGDPCVGPGAETTFLSQGTYILPVVSKPVAFIFVADRWNNANLRDSRYVWLPLFLEAGKPIIQWRHQWDLSVFA